MRRVVVTGLGAITPLGNNLKSSWDNICNGKSGIAKITQFDASSLTTQIAGEVKNFNPSHCFSPKELKKYARFVQLSIVASKEAFADASLEATNIDPNRMGCSIGVGIGNLEDIEKTSIQLDGFGSKKVSPFFIPYVITNMAAGNTATLLNLKGPNLCLSTACSSGTHAIGEAFLQIKNDACDIMVCGGAESTISRLALCGFGNMKALSTQNEFPEKASCPFSKKRDGFVISEGAGILVLEEYEHAKKRGARIYAELVGYGSSCDAYHFTKPSPQGLGAQECMKNALRSASLNTDALNYINAHGTSTYFNDLYETIAIKNVFKSHATSIAISSTKSSTGHCLGAAGGIEGVFLAKSVCENIAPPTINLEEPDLELDLDYTPHEARDLTINVGLSNSFGFGGTNASIVMKKM